MSSVGKLIVYKNKLYGSGSFFKANGNPGNCIFSYDGTNFNDLGGGFDTHNEVVHDMFVYKDKLVITGANSSYIPGTSIQAPNFFTFDGHDFCTYFNYQPALNYFGQIGTYNDTLLFSVASKTVGIDTVNYIAKYMGDFVPQNCVNVVGMEENSAGSKNIDLKIYPNPFINTVTIEATFDLLKTQLKITDVLGREVFHLNAIQSKEIELEFLPAGVYTLKVSSYQGSVSKKLIKQ